MHFTSFYVKINLVVCKNTWKSLAIPCITTDLMRFSLEAWLFEAFILSAWITRKMLKELYNLGSSEDFRDYF